MASPRLHYETAEHALCGTSTPGAIPFIAGRPHQRPSSSIHGQRHSREPCAEAQRLRARLEALWLWHVDMSWLGSHAPQPRKRGQHKHPTITIWRSAGIARAIFASMDNELFALRQQLYATAAAYHGAGATWMAARRAGASSEWQALDVLLAAGVEYDAVLVRLFDHLSTTAAGARTSELERAQRIRELLHEELALLRALQV